MKTLEDFGELMLGTRLKRLSDRMYSDVDALYKARNITISSRCFAPMITLLNNGPMAISELAEALGQSHASVSQVSKILLNEKIIKHHKDPKDERRRLISVTEKGKALAENVQDIWEDLRTSLSSAIHHSGFDLLGALGGLETQLEKMSLYDRVEQRAQLRRRKTIEIVPYSEKYRLDFKRLNVEWLQKYFYVEEIDDQVLSNPEQYILEPGGSIFFAVLEEEVLGTAALIKQENNRYELSKMSVTDKYQGLGIGKKLAQAAIDKYLQLNDADCLFLESNSRLKPALKLYEKLGFVHKGKKQNSHYQRADVYMIYEG